MDAQPLFQFLKDLSRHNDREWFQARKATYEQLRRDFEADVQYWIDELAKTDATLAGVEAKKSVFRIYRDVRFSKNKDPYKTTFSAFLSGRGKGADVPGYYLQLGPNGQTLVAGGLYMPTKEELARIRQEIDYNAAELKTILQAPGFARYFDGISGEKAKKTPLGFAADHPDLDLLKFKSFVVSHSVPDADVLRRDLRRYVLDAFRAMQPFCQFLRQAIGEPQQLNSQRLVPGA